MRLVFLGSPPFATPVLERLASSRFRPELVVTPPPEARGRGKKLDPSPLALRSRELGLALAEPPTVRDAALLEQLRRLEADVFFVVSYGELLRAEFLALPRVAALNVHPSLLPRHRGATPIQAALLAGDEVTGVTIQRIALELDAGDVLLARELAIRPGETAGELSGRLAQLAGDVSLEALELVDSGRARYVAQDPARVTFCKRLKKEDGRLDWERPADELERRVRALTPWPGAYTTLPGGQLLFVRRARRAQSAAAVGDARPGTVLETGGRFLVAAAPGGALELLELQAAGKRALPAAEFLRGARIEQGILLGGH